MSYAPNQILRWRQLHQLRSLLKNTSDEVALGRLSEDVGSFHPSVQSVPCCLFTYRG
jgi:hypothetical protein